MGGVFLTCCLAAFAVTRHFTPGLGDVIAWMLAAGLFLGSFLVVANLLFYPVRELVMQRADEGADRRARRG